MTLSRHVYIFRHCLRSTKNKVNLYQGKGKHKLKKYFKKKAPKWNTGESWCTSEGIEILKRTAAHVLFQNKNIGGQDNKAHSVEHDHSYHFVADTSQRDVDSALAFLLVATTSGATTTTADEDGKQSNTLTSSTSTPSSNLALIPTLFHPTENGVCNPVEPSILAQEIQGRLDVIPPPSNLSSILRRLRKYLNDDYDGVPNINHITLDPDKMHLKGPVNLVNIFAEMVLYSRASGIEYLPKLFRSDGLASLLSELQDWLAWERTILHTNTTEAAQIGAHVMTTVLDVLTNQQQDQHASSSHNIWFGHEGTLDALQTVLGLSWGTYSFTPPGSAIHIYTSDDENSEYGAGSVQVEFLYPTFFQHRNKNDGKTTINSTGILQPIFLKSFASLTSMRDHVQTQISTAFPHAMSCWNADSDAAAAAAIQHQETTTSTSNLEPSSHENSSHENSNHDKVYKHDSWKIGGTIGGLTIISCLLFLLWRRRPKRRQEVDVSYAPVTPEVEMT